MATIANFNFVDFFPTIIVGFILGALVIWAQFTLAKQFIKGEKATALRWYSRLFLVDGLLVLGVMPLGVFIPLSHVESFNIYTKGWIIVCVMYFFSQPFYDKKFDPRRW